MTSPFSSTLRIQIKRRSEWQPKPFDASGANAQMKVQSMGKDRGEISPKGQKPRAHSVAVCRFVKPPWRSSTAAHLKLRLCTPETDAPSCSLFPADSILRELFIPGLIFLAQTSYSAKGIRNLAICFLGELRLAEFCRFTLLGGGWLQ